MDYQKLMEKARETNKSLERHERKLGLLPISEEEIEIQIVTIMCSVNSGIKNSDWENVAESLELLKSVYKKLTGINYEL